MDVRLLLFAAAREAAGRGRDTFELAEGTSLEQLLAAAVDRYGASFAAVLGTARVWLNGDEPAGGAGGTTDGAHVVLHAGDEVAVLPPVSGGAG